MVYHGQWKDGMIIVHAIITLITSMVILKLNLDCCRFSMFAIVDQSLKYVSLNDCRGFRGRPLVL